MGLFWKFAAVLILLSITAATAPLRYLHGEVRRPAEYEVKAVFLYNLTKFVEWPDKSLDNASTMTLFIIGEDPFGSYLDLIKGKSVKGKTFDIKHVDTSDALKGAGIVFIANTDKDNLRHILKNLSGRPFLTVGDTQSFAKGGVMINFYIEESKIRFEINADAAKSAGMKISSNLLKMGKVITP
jgi:hypothetical protein